MYLPCQPHFAALKVLGVFNRRPHCAAQAVRHTQGLGESSHGGSLESPWETCEAMENGPFIVDNPDLPIEHGDFNHSFFYVHVYQRVHGLQ